MLIRYLSQAFLGRNLWKRIRHKYGNGDNYTKYIFFPDTDDEYNAWGLFYLRDYIEINCISKLLIVSSEKDILDYCEDIGRNVEVVKINLSMKKIDRIMRLMSLSNFTMNTIIMSVKKPYDTGAERMLGKNGTTKKDIVWYDMYRMSKTPRIPDLTCSKDLMIPKRYLNFIEGCV